MKSFLLRSTCVVGLVLGGQPVFAQTAEPQSDSAEKATGGLSEIVVTAQRRSENLQKAAIAVSAVTGDDLRSANITRPTELTSLVPALQVAPSAGPYNLFYLRGVGNFNANAFSDSAIAFNADGVYVGRPSSATGFFYDLERVEVVKGPQGTLYGRNATGGAINVLSKKPVLGKLGVEASADYGNYDALRLDGVVNLPIGDTAAFRVAAMRVKHDGYMNDGTDDQDDWGGRASLRVEPSDTVHINVVADYFHQDGRGVGATPLIAPGGVPIAATFNVDDRIGFFSTAGQAFYTSQRAATLGRNFSAFPAGFVQFQKNHWWGISATIDWKTDLGTLTIVPAYREGNLDYLSYTPGFQVRQVEKSNQTSVEARFSTNEDKPLRALVGGYYFKENTSDPAEAYASNWNGQFDNSMKLNTESKAIFGRLTYAVTPEIRFTVGARQTWEDKSFSGQRISLTRLCGLPPIQNCPAAPGLAFGTTPAALTGPGQVIVTAFGASPYGGFPDVVNSPALVQTAVVINQNEQGKFSKFTWRAGAEWDITSQNLLYASYETGFKAGGFFFSPAVGQYKPEEIQAYTIGSKNRFLNNRLQVNLELFHWRYSNQQISHLVTIATVPTFATENVGRARFTGFELETKFAVTDNTTLSADIQYLDAKYDQFIYTQTNSNGGAFNGTGCPSNSVTAAAYVVNCSGRRPANAPEWTVNVSGQQHIPVSFGEFVLDARAHYQSETMVGLEFLPVEFNKGYWLADAALTFYAPERRYFIGAYINNMFDETVKSQNFPTPGTAIYSTTLRPPRTFGIRAGVKF
jgi:iron complex outermembrane receptor protein